MGMDIKLIALDLDRTLLRNDGEVSTYSLEILEKCKKRGILIAVATARSEFSAQKYVRLIKPDIVITSGGAVAYLGNKILHKALIPQVTVNSIIEDALNQQSIECIRVMGEVHELSNKKNIPAGQKDYGHYDYSDLKEPMKEDAWKIQFETRDISFLKMLELKYPECELTSYTNEDLHKFANIRANKKDALINVCGSLEIMVREVAAFGDDSSDFELLKAVGMGVAVENAIDQIRNIADFICGSNETDGVAKFIEKNILGYNIYD